MNAQKLRRLIRMALVKGTADGIEMDGLPERIAATIELALEIEAADQDTEHHAATIGTAPLRSDPNAHSRDGWTSPIKISDSLAPPPLQSGSLILAKDTDTAPVIPIRPGTLTSAMPVMTQDEIKEAVLKIEQEVGRFAPPNLSVTPEGLNQPLVLRRQVQAIPEAGIVKLSYRLGVENTPQDPPRNGYMPSVPSQVSAMAVDNTATVTFSVEEGCSHGLVTEKMKQIASLASWIYRSDKVPVVSTTIPRPGPISFDPRTAAHEDV